MASLATEKLWIISAAHALYQLILWQRCLSRTYIRLCPLLLFFNPFFICIILYTYFTGSVHTKTGCLPPAYPPPICPIPPPNIYYVYYNIPIPLTIHTIYNCDDPSSVCFESVYSCIISHCITSDHIIIIIVCTYYYCLCLIYFLVIHVTLVVISLLRVYCYFISHVAARMSVQFEFFILPEHVFFIV